MAKYTITVKCDDRFNYGSEGVEVPEYLTASVARAIVSLDNSERRLSRLLGNIELGESDGWTPPF
jgi:hypothetical protein